jgi:hypothetical protein
MEVLELPCIYGFPLGTYSSMSLLFSLVAIDNYFFHLY